MGLKVKEVADLVGISVRTLHHYDQIGLLTPEKRTDSGYRIYTDSDLEISPADSVFRELDFPLKRLKRSSAIPPLIVRKRSSSIEKCSLRNAIESTKCLRLLTKQ